MDHYKDLGIYSDTYILPLLGRPGKHTLFSEETKEAYHIKLNSTRLKCFALNQCCVSCGIKGEVFILQRVKNEPPHLNFYAIDENADLVMMTQDHIQPRSKGGKNDLDNLQTMCYPCNQEKGDKVEL